MPSRLFLYLVSISLFNVAVVVPTWVFAAPSKLPTPPRDRPSFQLAQSVAGSHSTQLNDITFEQAIIAEINRVRTNPRAYAEQLESLRQYYEGEVLSLPGEDRFRTREGVAALDQAIAFLQKQTPLSPLMLSQGMSQAARDHARDLGASGRQGTVGQDGSQPSDRLKRYGAWGGQAIELISYGKRTATAVVALMVISDGDPNRTWQAELLHPGYQFVGIACGVHVTRSHLCVMDYAMSYVESRNVVQEAIPEATPIQSTARPSSSQFVPTSFVNSSSNSASVPVPTASDSALQAKVTLPSVASYLSNLERDIVTETNRLRKNPVAYAEELAELKQFYDGALLRIPGVAAIETQEGVAALEEAIAVLQHTPPLPLLTPSQGMSLGARDHVSDLGSSNQMGHDGTDGSDPFVRLNRHGAWSGVAGENISYSLINTAKWHVVQLLIDDGVPDRSHRKALLKPDFNRTGVACGAHRVYGNICVMNYAGQYQDR